MNTQHIVIKTEKDIEGIKKAAEILNNGGLVVIPTETVYGLAADTYNVEAVRNIFKAKGRPQDNPLIVHISGLEMLKDLCCNIPQAAYKLAEKYWPGPLTMVLPKSDKVPSEISAGLATVAVRFPKNPVARAIIAQANTPLAAPSANLSGSPSPTTAEHCIKDLEGRVDAIVLSGDSEVGLESTVVSLCENPPRLLRPGAVTVEQLSEVLGEVVVDKAVVAQPEEGKPVASPGMKYKHYSPKSRVILVEAESTEYIEYVNRNKGEGVFALCFEEDAKNLHTPFVVYGKEIADETQAAGLFAALRELDERGAKIAYAHSPKLAGVGLAVYNRLIRAAGFEVVKPESTADKKQ